MIHLARSDFANTRDADDATDAPTSTRGAPPTVNNTTDTEQFSQGDALAKGPSPMWLDPLSPAWDKNSCIEACAKVGAVIGASAAALGHQFGEIPSAAAKGYGYGLLVGHFICADRLPAVDRDEGAGGAPGFDGSGGANGASGASETVGSAHD